MSSAVPTEPSGLEFYLVVAPGLEDLAARELRAWAPELKPEVGRGGLTIQCELARGLGLNGCLKIPTRILVRIADFSARDFPKLFKKISNLEWSRWIGDDRPVVFKASSHASRLFVKKRIEETCLDGRKSYLKKKSRPLPVEGEPITVYVRLADDVCTVSLDTSGDRLHKRGHRELSSDAPLRESIAAALLWFTEGQGENAPVELVDPMCGAGTFFLEASGLKAPVDSRDFAFASWGGSEVASADVPSKCESNDLYASFVGFDIDQKAVTSAKKNWESTGDRRPLRVIEGSFFDAENLPPTDVRRWLVCNPPYGERIGVEGKLSVFYEKFFAAVAEKIRPERACFLLPDRARPNELKLPRVWKKVSMLRLSNGGLPVTALLVRT
ncbi:MAG: hypothetical protein V4760_05370 [Bdellovibrionota bacterium]